MNKMDSFMSILNGIVKGGGVREISAMAFANVITAEIFELICTYFHFTATSSVPTYQGPGRFFKIYPLYVISTE
jgi:hypothetical protein